LIGVYDNKEIYPLFRAQELYYENSEYNTLTSYGDLNALKDVNQNILSEYYYQILNEDQIDFLVTGNINSQKIFELCKLFPFTPKIKDDGIKNVIVPNNNCSLVLNKKEVQKNIQSKLIMIFNTYTYFIDSDYFELLVFNALFGSTPNSRLSYRIRTCESWAYYIFTNIDPFKGMIVLQTGISKNIKAKLEKIILEELKIIQSEKFSIGDLKKAKEIVKFQHALLDDDIASNLENSYLFKKYRNTVWNIDEFNSEIDSIRSSSIAKIANKIELHTSLFLEGQ
jgi:predicted Zn-dependent peptidase